MKKCPEQKKPQHVLVIATSALCVDGLTEVLTNVARITARAYHVSFALGEGCTAAVLDQLQQIGKVYRLPSRKKSLPLYMVRLTSLIRSGPYSIIHIHGNSATMAFDLLAAWVGGAKVRIAHCHNCAQQPALKQATLGRLLNRLVTDPVACSRAAGEMLYTKPYRILVNGIDCERFSFSSSVRKKMRSALGLQGKFVVGHIGRFSLQKNHLRLLHIFIAILDKQPDARLLLCGTGENLGQIQEEASRLGITENILFCGNVNDPEDYLQAMDVFILPSLFEGLPIVGIEAQACGLPCIFSDTITREAAVLPETSFVSLAASDAEWAEQALHIRTPDRAMAAHRVESAGYSNENLLQQVCALYRMEEAVPCRFQWS